MRDGIHPKWYDDATVTCACGNSWTTGATVQEIKVDVCSACHPFFTGERRIVDTEGQVDRFYKRLQVRDQIKQDADERVSARTSPDISLEEIGLSTRYVNVLASAELTIVGEVMAKLEEGGDDALLEISGFGRKALADLKKRLRERGYELPEGEPAE
ncbi:MAG: 50S ribosomal protein L31 [Anaerolineae bacterium]|nr:50S ribosomal protein L31 [Anaerolineae bacterium]